MDYWRNYFKSSNGDIFETIEKAIMVAASDFSKEFEIRRDQITQMLFNCPLIKCSGCDKSELGFPGNDKQENAHNHQVSNDNNGVADALTAEIEEKPQMFDEIVRIKEIVYNNQNESESTLHNSLKKLQSMAISIEILQATEIGKAVNALRKHSSKDVSTIAKALIQSWKKMLDEWMMAAEKTESQNPSGVEEEDGLPSPPLDDLAFLLPHMSWELSEKFFDGMDEDGNPINCEGFNKTHDPEPRPQKPPTVPKRVRKNEPKPEPKHDSELTNTKNKQQTVVKPIKPLGPESGPGRQVEPETGMKLQNVLKTNPQETKHRISGEAKAMDDEKFERVKRKLKERYQQLENAKKQRTIQVMEVYELPKRIPKRKQNSIRPGSNYR